MIVVVRFFKMYLHFVSGPGKMDFVVNSNYYYLGVKRMKMFKWLVAALLAILVVIVVAAAFTRPHLQKENKPVRVVTSLNFYGEVAKQVTGRYGDVTAIINSASIDPHDYQPGTKQAKQTAQANLVIDNGLGYDHWLQQLVVATNPRVRQIDVGHDIAKKGAGSNEHVWYNPAVMERLAKQVASDAGHLDPAHTAYYRQNARRYLRQLHQVDVKIGQLHHNIGNKRLVDVSEPVFDYSLHRIGYQVNDQHFAKAVEDGNDPSPKDIANIRSDIINHRIAFFVVNTQSSDRVIDNLVELAHQYDVPVLKVTESKPNGLTYPEWMLKQYRQLEKIQEGRS